jgi:hypothetical protein
MAFDAHRNRVVLFGGRVSGIRSRLLSDTWEWDGARWVLADTLGTSTPRIHMVMAYDPTRRSLVMHGGLGRPGPDPVLRDTWTWNGKVWSPVAITSALSSDHHIGLVTTPDGLLLLDAVADTGCASAESPRRPRVRVSTVRNGVWTASSSSGPCVEGVTPSVWTPDGVVLYASDSPNQRPAAWIWRDGTWRQLPAPPARPGGRIAYDAARRRVVLFGGEVDGTGVGETWEYDGTAWRRAQIP